MKLDIFENTAKHIAFSSIFALIFFALIASEEAQANNSNMAELDVINPTELHLTSNKQQLSEKIALVMHLEENVKQGKELLVQLEQQFDAKEINADTIFMATVQIYQIEEALETAKLELVLSLNQLAEPQLNKLIAQKYTQAHM